MKNITIMKNIILPITLLSSSLHAQVFNITSSDATSATGDIIINGSTAATFKLLQNSHTSMTGLIFTGGSNGIQVFSAQQDDQGNSAIVDATNYTFTVNSLKGYKIESTSLSQSAYENVSTSNNDPAEWSVKWSGSAGTVSDVHNQIVHDQLSIPDYADGASINAGDKFFTGHITNDVDSWSISMPANSFTVDYVSQNTTDHPTVDNNFNNHNRESFREWMTFNAEISKVPEPSSITLFAIGALGVIVRRKR